MPEKQFKPSKRKLENARKEGQHAKSAALTQAVVVLCAPAGFSLGIACSWVRIQLVLEYLSEHGPEPALFYLKAAAKSLLIILSVGLTITLLGAITAEVLQVGFRFDPGLLAPRAARLDPAGGIKRCAAGLTQVWVVVLKFVVPAAVLGWFFKEFLGAMTAAPFMPDGRLWAFVRSAGAEFAVLALLAFGALGTMDYVLQRRRFLRQVSMSVDEIRRELKEDEGDPHIRSFRRAQHHALALQDLARAVRRAKVIVVEKNR